MMKRTLCLILAVILTAVLAACGKPAPAPTEQTAAAAETSDTATSAGDTAPTVASTEAELRGMDLAAFIRAFDRKAQLEEQMIYDADGVTLTVEGLRYDPILGAAVRIKAVNTSSRSLLVQADTCAVNGYMMANDFSLSLPEGKTAQGELLIPYASLALAGADAILLVEFSPVLMDPVSYRVLRSGEPVLMLTSAAEQPYQPTYDEEGQKVYDEGGVRIVLKGIDRRRQISDYPALIVYMFNGTDRAISVQVDSLLVNGYEMTAVMTAAVMPGKGAVDKVEIFDMDLTEHDIHEIETAEVSFRIVDESTWETVARTDTVLVEEEPAQSQSTARPDNR